MISCGARNKIREQTLNELLKTDWGEDRSLILEMDDGIGQDPRERLTKTARRLLQRFGEADEDYLVFLEDDLAFNQHLRHNLMSWRPLSERLITFASIYNPGVREEGCDIQNRAYLVRPEGVYGSQALLLSRKTVEYILGQWDDVPGMPDIKMPRLAGRLNKPIYYHSPSLVQHVGQKSTWGGRFHRASDFDPNWRNIERQVAPYQELTSGLEVCCKNSF